MSGTRVFLVCLGIRTIAMSMSWRGNNFFISPHRMHLKDYGGELATLRKMDKQITLQLTIAKHTSVLIHSFRYSHS